jgi:recombination protein RecA
MKLGDKPNVEINGITTGALSIDLALGGRGIPRGRIVEIYGPESSGKTTLALQVVANAQKAGGLAAFIDAEHALDPTYAKQLGVDVDNLYVSQPDSGEQALDICETLVRSNAFDIIVVDSVAALVPKSELEGDMGDAQMGSQARLMSQAMRKLTAAVSRANTALVFINQIRMKIGIMFGNPETTTGGNALKFAATQRIEIRRGAPIKVGDDVIGHETSVKIVKNKLAPPFKKVIVEMIFGEGISRQGDLLELGATCGVIKRSGAWWTYGSNKLGQGKENAKVFLRGNADIEKQIDHAVREALALNPDAGKKASKDAE